MRNAVLTIDSILINDDLLFIEGWAIDKRDPSNPCSVKISSGEKIIGSTVCDTWREDLAEAGLRDGHCAFQFTSEHIEGVDTGSLAISIPETTIVVRPTADIIKDQRSSRTFLNALFSIGEDGTDVEFQKRLDVARARIGSHLTGRYEIRHGDSLIGWAIDLNNPEKPPVIEVLIADKTVWRGPATLLMPVPDAPDGRLECGFRLNLPKDMADGSKVEVRIAGSRKPLAGPTVVALEDRYQGNIDRAERHSNGLEITGWVHDRARPLDQLPIVLRINGQEIHSGWANELRKDLEEANIGTGRHSFVFQGRLPANLNGHTFDIQLEVAGTQFRRTKSTSPETPATGNASGTNQAPPVVYGPAYTGVVEGNFENVENSLVIGWARNAESSTVPVLVDLHVDGLHFASTLTTRFRGDVANAKGDHGFHGFAFELPPTYDIWSGATLSVSARGGIKKINNQTRRHLFRTQPGFGLYADRTQLLNSLIFTPNVTRKESNPKIALIVLTLNSASLIEEFLTSFALYNSYENYEIIVIDHNSTDKTEDTVKSFSNKIKTKHIKRKKNYSFSESNNYALNHTDADYIAFANNDLSFCQDILRQIADIMSDTRVGALGVKLRDYSFGSNTQGPAQHVGVHFGPSTSVGYCRPFETRPNHSLWPISNALWKVPVVTGAFCVMRRSDFVQLGGFSENYIYGFEDVDLCLRVLRDLKKEVVCANNLEIQHLRGFTRSKPNDASLQFRKQNQVTLDRTMGPWLRRQRAQDLLEKNTYWTTRPPVIAFAVTEVNDTTPAGDYFTALELGESMKSRCGADIVFLDKIKTSNGVPEWYDMTGIDILIAMVDSYDLRQIKNATQNLIKIAWVRNWIDRWPERPWAEQYDAWWASSQIGADYVSKATDTHCAVIPIATNWARFSGGKFNHRYASDYVFTGNFWNSPREIAYFLDPSTLPFKCRIFGNGWDDHERLGPYAEGLVSYKELPDLYASTRVVIDDANHVTKPWGSVNSRVFDAIAAGALPITNGVLGAREMFGELMPTYTNMQELDTVLSRYLNDEALRRSTVLKLQDLVRQHHTYDVRADHALVKLREKLQSSTTRIAIKIGAPRTDIKHEWGDWHYARAMKRALVRLGYSVRIDCIDTWYGPAADGDDAVIVLRGLTAYEPRAHQINLIWTISHPDKIPNSEYESYDHVFVASESLAASLSSILTVPTEPLLQCTDPEIFYHKEKNSIISHDLLFVGNSRGVYRKIVKDSIEADLPISVYGTKWNGFIDEKYHKDEHIDNEELPNYYSSATVVLNDHWDSMRKYGIISNRIFDAVACGAIVVSDHIDGLEEIFGGSVVTYHEPDDLKRKVMSILQSPAAINTERDKIAHNVRENHSFQSRMNRVSEVLEAKLKKNINPSMAV